MPTLKLSRRTFLKGTLITGVALWMPALIRCARSEPVKSPSTSNNINIPQRSNTSLHIISRSVWGAVEPDLEHSAEGIYTPLMNPKGWLVYEVPLPDILTTMIVHHSALPFSDGPLEIQRKHMQTRSFADIGYHFIINEMGQIYEGRSIHARGAHTGGYNTDTIGTVLLGNFEEITPTEAQIVSLKALCRYLTETYAITHIAGHRDFQPGITVCPGENLAPLLPDLANEVHLNFGTEGYKGA